MAAVKGDVGKIMFHNAAGTEADISGLRNWSLSITKDTQETTVQGDTSKSFVGGLISGEGSAELSMIMLETQTILHLLKMSSQQVMLVTHCLNCSPIVQLVLKNLVFLE